MEWGETDECGLKSRRSLSALEKGRLMLDKQGGAKAEGSGVLEAKPSGHK